MPLPFHRTSDPRRPPHALRLRAGLAAGALAAALLSACGGGGGDGGGAIQPPPVAIDPAVPAGGYADAARQTLYQQLNTMRLGAGAGAVLRNAQLDAAAAAHLEYLRLNGVAAGHAETPGRPGFTGSGIGARATAAGYEWRLVSEDLAWGTGFTPEQCLDLLLASVYHLASLMAEQRDMGVAFGPAGGGNLNGCVFNFGVARNGEPQLPAPGTPRLYPYPGQSGVATTFVPSTESPNPMPDVGGARVGQPVFVSLRARGDGAASSYAVSSFTLRDATGAVVPARLIVNGTVHATGSTDVTADPVGLLRPGEVFLVPRAPLAGGATYSVSFAGRNGDVPYAANWQFRTR